MACHACRHAFGLLRACQSHLKLSFVCRLQALVEPGEFLLSDFAKLDRSAQLHLGFQALDAFQVCRTSLDGAYLCSSLVIRLQTRKPQQCLLHDHLNTIQHIGLLLYYRLNMCGCRDRPLQTMPLRSSQQPVN